MDPAVIRKTHPRSILAFIKAVGLGLGLFFLERKGQRREGHNRPVY
jgi:hypothetical protein